MNLCDRCIENRKNVCQKSMAYTAEPPEFCNIGFENECQPEISRDKLYYNNIAYSLPQLIDDIPDIFEYSNYICILAYTSFIGIQLIRFKIDKGHNLNFIDGIILTVSEIESENQTYKSVIDMSNENLIGFFSAFLS